jgi:predicted CopG family antitoxin
MAFKTLTVKESAYRTLATLKQPGESFSAVIERELGGRILTVDDLLAHARVCRATRRPLLGSRLDHRAS